MLVTLATSSMIAHIAVHLSDGKSRCFHQTGDRTHILTSNRETKAQSADAHGFLLNYSVCLDEMGLRISTVVHGEIAASF